MRWPPAFANAESHSDIDQIIVAGGALILDASASPPTFIRPSILKSRGMPEPTNQWIFERIDPNASGSSGKISDLFRNEGVEPHGHLSRQAPPSAATLMAREVIQNSWDAARELRAEDPAAPPFYLDFIFKRSEGQNKERLIEALGLRELATHAAQVAGHDPDARKKLGLGAPDCLNDLDERANLSYCEIIEHGATGMYGAWSGAKSRMYLAMLSIGYNEKADGSGGTFGYGKAGLIRASHPRIVVAYTCFRARQDDPSVTRRLLGVTYWGRHEDGQGNALNGFARFGSASRENHVRPFENEQADEIAADLGLGVRSPDEVEELGTTFLVLDPVVAPDDLREAVERNWWPALLDERFSVLVTDSGGAELPCRPRSNPELSAYVAAYDILRSASANPPNERLVDLGSYQPQGQPRRMLGRVALVADPAGWSYPDDANGADAGLDHRSLIALTRTPRMVVEYHLPGRDISRRTPYVRGLFVADDDVNAYLGLTEPKAHDKWDDTRSDDVDATATAFAGEILGRIRSNVRDFQNALRPPVDETGAVRLQRLDQKLKRLRERGGDEAPPPPPGERPYAFRIDVARRGNSEGLILSGKVAVGLATTSQAETIESKIRISLAIDEDGRRGDAVPLHITPPPGFHVDSGDETRFIGPVSHDPVEFELESEPYRDDWTGELLVSGEETEVTGH
jgi:hypothetical protein